MKHAKPMLVLYHGFRAAAAKQTWSTKSSDALEKATGFIHRFPQMREIIRKTTVRFEFSLKNALQKQQEVSGTLSLPRQERLRLCVNHV